MPTIKLKPRTAELHPLHSVRHYETGMTELTLKLTRGVVVVVVTGF